MPIPKDHKALTLYVPNDMYARLKSYADAQDRPVAWIIRAAVEQLLFRTGN